MKAVVALALAAAAFAEDDPQILARPIIYEVESGTFTCLDIAARCVFNRSLFSYVNDKNGQQTRNEEGDVWAAIVPSTSFLELEGCSEEGGCQVVCNARCSCVTPDGEDCAIRETRAPVAPPPTPSPVPQICPESSNIQFCAELMKEVESNNFFQCYNFCNGELLSACQFTGECGTLECTGEEGTINGLVTGCTDARDAPNRKKTCGYGANPNGGGSSGANANTDCEDLDPMREDVEIDPDSGLVVDPETGLVPGASPGDDGETEGSSDAPYSSVTMIVAVLLIQLAL